MLTLAYGGIAWMLPGIRSPYSSLYFTIAIFCVNGAGFALAALTPLSPRYDGVKRFYERYGRSIIIVDMQLTMVSLAFLWLAIVGAIYSLGVPTPHVLRGDRPPRPDLAHS